MQKLADSEALVWCYLRCTVPQTIEPSALSIDGWSVEPSLTVLLSLCVYWL